MERNSFPVSKVYLHCPHCTKPITALIRNSIEGVVSQDGDVSNPSEAHWRTTLDNRQKSLIALAESNGTLVALETALKNSNVDMPKNVAKYFLLFVERGQQITVPRASLDFLVSNFGGLIEVWRHNAIVGVLCDKRLVMFAPYIAIRGKNPGKNGTGGAIGMRSEYLPMLMEWVRTRMGYVPAGGGAFADELNKRQVGDFARAST